MARTRSSRMSRALPRTPSGARLHGIGQFRYAANSPPTGVIGTELVSRSAPDGATILFGTSSSMGSSPAILPNLPYDVIKDFIAVGVVATDDYVLVGHPSVPAGNVLEFIAYPKASPRKFGNGPTV